MIAEPAEDEWASTDANILEGETVYTKTFRQKRSNPRGHAQGVAVFHHVQHHMPNTITLLVNADGRQS